MQLQTVIWCSSGEPIIECLNPEEYGWSVDPNNENLEPVWFSGPQLPPSLNRRKKKVTLNNSVAVTEAREADADAEGSDDVQPKNLGKRVLRNTKNSTGPDIAAKKIKTTAKIASGSCESKSLVEEETIQADDEQTNEEDIYRDSQESDWEVSDFNSSNNDSDPEW